MALREVCVNKSYSIAEARDNLASIVHDAEETSTIELRRRVKPVTVLLSVQEHRRLAAGEKDLWGACTEFRQRFDCGSLMSGPKSLKVSATRRRVDR